MSSMTEPKYRHELKYLVSLAQVEHLKMRMRALLPQDIHAGAGGTYSIRSLYFDDYDNRCYYENENGVDPREKFRIRIYDHSTSRIMLECKRKERGRTSKMSCQLTQQQAQILMEGKWLPDLEKQPLVLRKLTLKMMLCHMHPVIIVDYDRFPFVYHNGNVRITLDTNVVSASKTDRFFDPQLPKRPVLPMGWQLLEVKFDEYLPDQIYRSLQLENLQQTPFSKYYVCRRYFL